MKHSCKLLHCFNVISNFLATQLISVDIAYYVDPYYVDSAPTHVGMLYSCFPLSFESLHTRMVCAFVLEVRLSRRKGMKSSKLDLVLVLFLLLLDLVMVLFLLLLLASAFHHECLGSWRPYRLSTLCASPPSLSLVAIVKFSRMQY
jgi:hypothetical protein